jgi:hypothetical protein
VRTVRLAQRALLGSYAGVVVLIAACVVAATTQGHRLPAALQVVADMAATATLPALGVTFACGICNHMLLDRLRRGPLVEAAAKTGDPHVVEPLLVLLARYRAPWIGEHVMSAAARLLPAYIAACGGTLRPAEANRVAKAAGLAMLDDGQPAFRFQIAVLSAWAAGAAPARWPTVRYLRAAGKSPEVRRAAARCAVALWGPNR